MFNVIEQAPPKVVQYGRAPAVVEAEMPNLVQTKLYLTRSFSQYCPTRGSLSRPWKTLKVMMDRAVE